MASRPLAKIANCCISTPQHGGQGPKEASTRTTHAWTFAGPKLSPSCRPAMRRTRFLLRTLVASPYDVPSLRDGTQLAAGGPRLRTAVKRLSDGIDREGAGKMVSIACSGLRELLA